MDMIRCYFVRGGWRFYADTAAGRAKCADDYREATGCGVACVCEDAGARNARGVVDVVVRVR